MSSGFKLDVMFSVTGYWSNVKLCPYSEFNLL